MSRQVKEYIKELTNRYNMKFIPIQKLRDTKGKYDYVCKAPAVAKWQKDEIPTDEEIDSWKIFGIPSGVGLVCGEASNLVCIDVDITDLDLIAKITKYLPHNAPIIQGNRDRLGKILFKLREYPNEPLQVSKLGKWSKNGIDFLLSGCQIVVPPSIHSIKDGKTLYYQWAEGSNVREGEMPTHEQLPILTDEIIHQIEGVVSGVPDEINKYNAPKVEISKDRGRYNNLMTLIAQKQRQQVPLVQAVKEVIEWDLSYNGEDNMILLEPNVSKTGSPEIDCLYIYANMLVKHNKGRTWSDMEIPADLTLSTAQLLDDWKYPIFPEKMGKIKPYNHSMVPENIRRLVVDAAEANSVPVEICLMAYLTALSSLIGNKVKIGAKRNNKSWTETHNIWCTYASKSGTRKSQILTIMMNPIRELQKDVTEQWKREQQERENLRRVIEAQIKELRKQIDSEAVSQLDEGGGTNEFIKEKQELLLSLESQIEVKPHPELTIGEVTPERFLEIMRDNPHGTLMLRNEITSLTNSFSKKGYENYRQDIMDAWDGNQKIGKGTKLSGTVSVENAALSIYGAIQPSLFRKEMDMIAQGEKDDGFWQRMFIVFNDAEEATKALDISFDIKNYERENMIMKNAFWLDETEEQIALSDEAYSMYMKFEDQVNKMAFDANIEALSSFWSKLTGKVVRIASLVEFIQKGEKEIIHKEISKESMEISLYIMTRQIIHVKSFFKPRNETLVDEFVYQAKMGIIQSPITVRDLVKRNSGLFGKDKDKLINELCDRNIIRIKREGKSNIMLINPLIQD